MKKKPFADAHIHIRGANIESIRKLLDIMAELGVTHTAIQALPYRSISENLSALYHKLTYDKMEVRAFGGFHCTDRYAEIPYEKQFERLMELGFDGIKLLDMDPWLYLVNGHGTNHESYDRVFSMMEERRTPFLLHSNDPRPCWDAPDGQYADPKFPSWDTIYNDTLDMLNKHPRLNIVLAHFFFVSDDIDKARRLMENYPNVRLDLTPGGEMYKNFSMDIDAWHDFFVTYQDRILFGTDSNCIKSEQRNRELNEFVRTALTHDGSEYTKKCYVPLTVRGLYLPETVVNKICFDNYIAFAGEKPKAVDVDGFYSAVEYTLSEMKKNPEDKYYDRAAVLLPFTGFANDPEQKIATDFFECVLSEKEQLKNF